MRTLIILFIPFIFFTESFAQSGWVLQNSSTSNNLYSISTLDGINVIAVGEKGTVTMTNNAGKPSWNLKQGPSDSNLYGITSISKNIFLAVGLKDSIYRSMDHGTTWGSFFSGVRGECWTIDSLRQLWAITFDHSNGVSVAVGDQNEAVFSVDSGAHWEENLPYMMPQWHLSNLKCISSEAGNILSSGTSIGYAASPHRSQLFTTTNQGDDWINSTTDPVAVFTSPDFLGCDSKTWILVGTRGVIFHSKNKGASWDSIPSGTLANLNSVCFAPDAVNGFIVGDSGVILSTHDGGNSWVRESSPTMQNLHSVTMVDPFHVYICGNGGTILWTQDGGFDGVPSQNGDVALKIQSFPNPLSAKTTIQVFLREARFLNLQIFNTLGIEVTGLANSVMEAGSHSFEWNVGEIPNGIYICRLESNGESVVLQLIVAK